MATTNIDDEGRCPRHPTVQLSRLSPHMSEWKILMASCPLCLLDGISTAGVVLPLRCSEGKDEGNPPVFDRTAPSVAAKARQRGLLFPPPPPPPPPPSQRRSRSSERCGSRVRFQPDKDVIFTNAIAMTKAKSVLKASPKYKVCEEIMEQQLDESERVTTMSMDLCIDIDDDDSRINFNHIHNEKAHNGHKNKHDGEETQVEDEKNRELKVQLPPLSRPYGNENANIATSTKTIDDIDHQVSYGSLLPQKVDDEKWGGGCGRRSKQQVQVVCHRLDPEEHSRGNISSSGSHASSHDWRSQRNPSSHHRRFSSQQQQGRGRQEVGGGEPQHESRSASLSVAPRHQQENRQQRQQQDSSLALSTPQFMGQPRQASPRSITGYHHQLNHRQHQRLNAYNMVVIPGPDDDEVSALSFPCSVRSASSDPNRRCASIYENELREQVEHKTYSSDAEELDNAYTLSTSLLMTMTNTSNYDPKSGRCIHHPHIRLRKKNLFGRGWSVLLSACPDCCVDELRRLHLVKEKMNRSVNKEKTIEGDNREGSVDVSVNTDGSGDVDYRSTTTSEGIISMRSSNEGGTQTKRISINLSRSSSSSSDGRCDGPKGIVANPKTKTKTKTVPPPPPRRSPSRDIHRGPPQSTPRKFKGHLESDDMTASSSGGSSNQGGCDHSRSRQHQLSTSVASS
jgi:hypothetical protein